MAIWLSVSQPQGRRRVEIEVERREHKESERRVMERERLKELGVWMK